MARGRKPLSIETRIERAEKLLAELKAKRDGVGGKVEPVVIVE